MRLNGVEAGRGIAALLVVLVHASDISSGQVDFGRQVFAGLFTFGHAGVDFFFVLSGFIIYFIHHQDVGHPSVLSSYVAKRAARIYPAYWVALAIFGAILVVSPTRGRTEQEWTTIIDSIWLLPSLRDPILGVAWTLRHELLFYAAFAVLIVNRRAGWLVLGAWGVTTAANALAIFAIGSPLFQGVAGSLLFRLFNLEFFVGILAAHALLNWRIPAPRALALGGAALFLGNGLYEAWVSTAPIEYLPRHIAYSLGAGLAIVGLAAAERAGTPTMPGLHVPRPLLILGQASYSLYLTHVIVLLILQQIARAVMHRVPLPPELVFTVEVAIAVIAGVVFCRVIELPLLRLSRRLLLGRKPAVPMANA